MYILEYLCNAQVVYSILCHIAFVEFKPFKLGIFYLLSKIIMQDVEQVRDIPINLFITYNIIK